jgi:hypothetical protein
MQENNPKVENAMSAITDGKPANKVAANWVQKLSNRKSRRYTFLDLGATSRAASEEDEQELEDTGETSRKTFMFPDGCTRKQQRKCF